MRLHNKHPAKHLALWLYIFENCEDQYIQSERAYSAYITVAGYDYQEYELTPDRARQKLADTLEINKGIIKWFNNTKST